MFHFFHFVQKNKFNHKNHLLSDQCSKSLRDDLYFYLCKRMRQEGITKPVPLVSTSFFTGKY